MTRKDLRVWSYLEPEWRAILVKITTSSIDGIEEKGSMLDSRTRESSGQQSSKI
jgi:hypothetical protein